MIYKIFALLIMLVFYACYFIKMINQKKQGIQTNQLGKGKEGFIKYIEIALKAVSYIIPLVEIISIFFISPMLSDPLRIVGAGIGIAGDAVFIISVLTMSDSWRAGVSESDKTSLVTTGIYSISRNPAFLGFYMVYLGILLMFFNIPLLTVTLIGFIMFHLQIVNVEEEFLISAFGNEYLEYCKKVNRYIGRKIK